MQIAYSLQPIKYTKIYFKIIVRNTSIYSQKESSFDHKDLQHKETLRVDKCFCSLCNHTMYLNNQVVGCGIASWLY